MKFIIIGAGDVGKSLSTQLAAHHHDVVVVDRNSETLNSELSGLDLKVVVGNACAPDVLTNAGIESADYVISVTDSDEVNIAACFVSRLLNPAPKRIARVRDLKLAASTIPQELLGEYFDLLVNPEEAGAEYLLKLFKLPGAREFADLGAVRVLGLAVTEHSPALGKSLQEIHQEQDESLIKIVALVRSGKMLCPAPEEKLRLGDIFYAVTVPEQTKKVFQLSGRELRHSQSAMMWGGSFLAGFLAERLDLDGVRVKLILTDENEQYEMADHLRHALVLNGEGTDQNLLIEEHVDEVDVFIAATDDEEDNVLAALLAKKLGVKNAVAVVNKASYLSLVSAVGVDVVVSSRLAASSAIFRHIHSKSLVTEVAPDSDGGCFVELDVTGETPLIGSSLAEIPLPSGAQLAAVVREGKLLPPGAGEALCEGDRAIFFTLKSSMKKLEKLLRLSLETLQ